MHVSLGAPWMDSYPMDECPIECSMDGWVPYGWIGASEMSAPLSTPWMGALWMDRCLRDGCPIEYPMDGCPMDE